MNYKIIVTLGEEEIKEVQNKLAIVQADIIEIRLDLISLAYLKEDLSEKLKELGKPILFTYRNPKDSSESTNTKLEYKDIESLLSEFNREENYLDIEMDQEKSIFDSNANLRYTVIYSYHNFSKSIGKEEMLGWISTKNKPNCIYKFAVSPRDSVELAAFLNDLAILAKRFSVIGIAMGEIGVYSRLFGDSFGSLATYCCVGNPRAPGQINVLAFQNLRVKYQSKPIPDLNELAKSEWKK